MRRAVLALAVVLLASGIAFGQDFRKVTWGMSVDDVTAAEKDLHFSRMDGTTKSILSSPVVVMGVSGTLAYIFEDGKLVMAQYRLDDEDDMRTYAAVLAALTDKYGQAFDSDPVHSRWGTERTFIGLSFTNDLCRVDYADESWLSRIKQKQREEYDSLF